MIIFNKFTDEKGRVYALTTEHLNGVDKLNCDYIMQDMPMAQSQAAREGK
jgi:hypothetical protein